MIKVYVGKGCVSCHKVVNKLNDYTSEVYVERDEVIVGDIISKTFGVVPVFEHNGVFYNEYQISSMIDNGFDFNISKEDIIENVAIDNIDIIEPKIINKKTNRRNNE